MSTEIKNERIAGVRSLENSGIVRRRTAMSFCQG
jgi:hypothetical protein